MNVDVSREKPAGFPWLALSLGLVALLILLGLGTWQVERLAWKQNLIATIDSRIAAPPVPLENILASPKSIADQEYTPVRVAGTFRHQSERHFFATWQGKTGFYVYAPLALDDGSFLFVNRGFVPYERKDPATRVDGQVPGRVEFDALVRSTLAEKPSSLVPDNDPAKNVFYWKDIRAMAETAGLPGDAKVLGLFVDAREAPVPGGLPVGGVTMIDLPNNHLQYAFTWYGIAAALVGVLGVWTWRRIRGSHT